MDSVSREASSSRKSHPEFWGVSWRIGLVGFWTIEAAGVVGR